jgi:hypothetical protein
MIICNRRQGFGHYSDRKIYKWDVPVTVFGSSCYVVMGYTQNALIRLDACNDRNK